MSHESSLILGVWGERLAAWFLTTQGLTIEATNVRVDRGEIDIMARDGAERVAVEVRSRRGDLNEVTVVDQHKLAQMNRNARGAEVTRVDLVVIAVGSHGIRMQWTPGI